MTLIFDEIKGNPNYDFSGVYLTVKDDCYQLTQDTGPKAEDVDVICFDIAMRDKLIDALTRLRDSGYVPQLLE